VRFPCAQKTGWRTVIVATNTLESSI